MNDWDFTFERPEWEVAVDALRPGDSLSALRLLALLEGEDEDAVEEAFRALEEKQISLDLANLRGNPGSGAGAVRLREEEQLVRQGKLPEGLEENDPLRLYLEEVASLPTNGADMEALAQRCLTGDERAQAALADGCLNQVVRLAEELTGRGVLLLDLIQEGSLGLWQSVLRYEGGGFAHYADWWIRFYMAKTVILQARANGVGLKLRKALEAYQAADKRLLTELGRNPTLEEIALEIHMTPEDTAVVEKMLRDARAVAKAQEPEKQTDAEAEQAVEDTAYFQSRQRIMELLSCLNEEDARILSLRFGLEGGLPLSPQETGRKLGLTAEEVTARETDALRRLRSEG